MTKQWKDPRDAATLTPEGRWYATQLLQLAMQTLLEADRLFRCSPGMPWLEQYERLRARQHAEEAILDAMAPLRDPSPRPTQDGEEERDG